MEAARRDGAGGWQAVFAAPAIDLAPVPAAEIDALFRGDPEADECERALASVARVRGALDVALAEGLAALRRGDRLVELGCHLDDYAREALDLGEHAARNLAALGAALATRPRLRDALRSGQVRLRAAEVVLPVAAGEREAEWVERARRCTVRELEAAVRRARAGEAEPEEDWVRLGAHLAPEERLVVDAALDLAGDVLPGSSRVERIEAMAQELLGSAAPARFDPREERAGPTALDPAFRPVKAAAADCRAALEAETERWAALPPVLECPVPDAGFDESARAPEIDRLLHAVARLRARWDEIVGHCAWILKQARLHRHLGFKDFRHFVEERLGLPPRAVEQRVALEERLRRSPPLQEARRQKVGYEKLRLLARLPDRDVARWIAPARALTCIALRRRVEGEQERQMRAVGRLALPMPRRIAALLSAAVEAVRAAVGCVLPSGKALMLLAKHFLDVWRPLVRRSRTRSRQVRDRDQGWCQAPGCSRRATHAHHVEFRSHGGGDESENQVALCGFHHLRCIHGGWLRVVGRAPDALRWFLGGKAWVGPRVDS